MFTDYGQLGAEVYDHTKPIGFSINGDIEFYRGLLKDAKGRVLEAGVGTGRMLIPLVKDGLKIDGVDLSFEMLDRCKENCELHELEAALYLQDLKGLELPEKYEYIIIPTGSINLIKRQDIDKTIQSLKEHLEKDGSLVIDIGLPDDFILGKEDMDVYEITEETGIIQTTYHKNIDWLNQKTEQIIRYEEWIQGELVKTEISDFVLYWYGIEEFKMILERNGFKDIEYIVDYGSGKKSNIITFIANN